MAESQNPSPRDYRAARQEQLARERGKSLPHYARKVARIIATPARRGKVARSKKAS